MAKHIVYRFESIKIDGEQRNLVRRLVESRYCLRQPLSEMPAVRQACKHIMIGEKFIFLGRLNLFEMRLGARAGFACAAE